MTIAPPDRPEYYVQTGSMFENPYGVPHEEIIAMMLEMPAEMAAQVIFGKYVESSGIVFSGELVQQFFDRGGVHYDGVPFNVITGDRWWCRRTAEELKGWTADQKRRYFHTGIDFARLKDFTALITIDTRTRPARVVGYTRLNRVPWNGIYREVGRAAATWGPSMLADSTGMAGDVILDALDERLYCDIHDRILTADSGTCRDERGNPLGNCGTRVRPYIRLSCVDGFPFTNQSKGALIENLRNLLSVGYHAGSEEPFGWLRCPPIATLEDELSFYTWDDKKLDTDTVMALSLSAWQGLEQVVGPPAIGGTR